MSETPDVPPEETPNASTGHQTVDGVVSSLVVLDQRPVEEHVAVFEAAHETLRSALSGAGAPRSDRPTPGPRS